MSLEDPQKTKKKKKRTEQHPYDLERQRSSHGGKKKIYRRKEGVCHPIKAYISHSFENLSQECTRSSVHLLYYCLLTRINMRIKKSVWFICTRWVQDLREWNANERPGKWNKACFAKCACIICAKRFKLKWYVKKMQRVISGEHERSTRRAILLLYDRTQNGMVYKTKNKT